MARPRPKKALRKFVGPTSSDQRPFKMLKLRTVPYADFHGRRAKSSRHATKITVITMIVIS